MSRGEAIDAARSQARTQRPKAFDLLAALRRPISTAAMRRDAAQLHATDLVLLVCAFDAQRGTAAATAARHEELLAQVLRCDASAPTTLRSLATEARKGVRGDAGAQIAWAAGSLAARGVPTSPACAG